VIKLKDILKEITTEQKTTSWLSPTGEFIHSGLKHQYTAAQIVYDMTGKHHNDAQTILWEKGWQRVTYYSRGVLYSENRLRIPNDLQKKLLIDLTKEIGFGELVYDSGFHKFILWSKKDTLQETK
jgi:hypothetical protein